MPTFRTFYNIFLVCMGGPAPLHTTVDQQDLAILNEAGQSATARANTLRTAMQGMPGFKQLRPGTIFIFLHDGAKPVHILIAAREHVLELLHALGRAVDLSLHQMHLLL